MQLHNFLGFSLYLSTFASQWPTLAGWAGTGVPVFLSLHISEEFSDDYCDRARKICRTLNSSGFRIVADVSVKTLAQFGCKDLPSLAQELGLWALRIDYGFSPEEIGEMAKRMPIVLNASTTTAEDARRIAAIGKEVYAMHNFYPRPETGLDEDLLLQTTLALQDAGLKVLAFIPGDAEKRGPLFEGLPTLEAHRNCPPSAAYAHMLQTFHMDGVFIGDPGLCPEEAEYIALYQKEDILSVPATLSQQWQHLYGQVFTCRIDSPKWMVRFQESRTYSCKGQAIAPEAPLPRKRGCVTIDNANYGRYTGEIQLLRQDFPADSRVNVIGQVAQNALLAMDLIQRGQRFRLVPIK